VRVILQKGMVRSCEPFKFSWAPTVLPSTYKVLTITQPPYLHSLISVQCPRIVLALHPSLLLLGHIHHPLLKLLTDPFGMLHRVSENLPVSQILSLVVPLLLSGLSTRTFSRTVSSELFGYCFYFFLNFLFLCSVLD